MLVRLSVHLSFSPVFIALFQGFFVSIIYCFCNGEVSIGGTIFIFQILPFQQSSYSKWLFIFSQPFRRFAESPRTTFILLVIVLSQVQTEIRKTWLRWTLAFDWKGPIVLANYRYGTVLNSSGTSVQSHLTSVTRSSALLDSRVYHCAAQPSVGSLAHCSQIHTTLPGYVFSNSDIESLPPSIPEEIEEEAKHIDDITLKGVNHNAVKQEALSICFEESGQSSSHTDSEDVRCHPEDITTMEISKCTDKLSLKYSLSVRYHSLDQEDEEVL